MNTETLVRTHSHRAYDKLLSLLDTKPVTLFSFRKDGNWHIIPESKLTEALNIKGITKAKRTDDMMQCWN